jgi:F-type H+-transporting ATPase subunit a
MWRGSVKNWFSHLVPTGTPIALIPFIVLIETVRLLIRPFTLAVRLSANMIAGHLLLSLIGGALAFSWTGGVVIIAQTCLFILELAVAVLQAFVFATLLTLYSREKYEKGGGVKGVGRQMLVFSGLDLYARWVGVN